MKLTREEYLLNTLKSILNIPLTIIVEGKTKAIVPDLKSYEKNGFVDPCWTPIFYNPAMKTNRDLSVAAVMAFKEYSNFDSIALCEPLTATGIRGLRYAVEASADYVVLNDIDIKAASIAKANIMLNEVEDKVEVFNLDANILLILCRKFSKFNVIDIDPYGSPEPFVRSALTALTHKGMLCLTATDLAPLTGVHRRSCIRRYFSFPMKIDCSLELAARILYYDIVKKASPLNIGIKPLLTFKDRHYIRCFVQVFKSRKKADENLSQIGYLHYCSKCGYRNLIQFRYSSTKCPVCGSDAILLGPLWTGRIFDSDFCQKTYSKLKTITTSIRLLEKMELLLKECSIDSPYITTEILSKATRLNEVSAKIIVENLVKKGYRASLTHFDSKGFKTNAPYSIILELIKALSSSPHSISNLSPARDD